MGLVNVFCLLFLFNLAFSEDANPLLKACSYKDMECLSKSTETFLEKTSSGIPSLDIKPIDPLVIPTIETTISPELVLKLTNVTVTGLENQQISDFSMNINEKSVVLATSCHLNITCDATLVSAGKERVPAGTITAKAHTITTANYNYELKTHDNGLTYFHVGPETNVCKLLKDEEVQAKFSPELEKAVDDEHKANGNAPDSNAVYSAFKDRIICEIVATSYVTVVHNIRAAAKVLPKQRFFTDV